MLRRSTQTRMGGAVLRGALMVATLTALTAGAARAETIDEMFERGNQAYFQERYKDALDGWQRVVEDFGVDDPALAYNLGNAAYKLDRLGEAVYWYKRALSLDPPEAVEGDARANLDLVRAALTERYRKEAQGQFVFDESHGAAWSVFTLLPPAGVQWAFVGAWLALFGLLAARRLRPSRGRVLAWAAGAMALITLVTGVFWVGNQAVTARTRLGVVVAKDTELKEGRHPDAAAHAIPEGLEVRIVDTVDPEWTRIELSNGLEGWVPVATVREIGG